MKRTPTFISLFFLLISCGQSSKTEIINNEKGDHHVKIIGTNVYIIPPDGFTENATGEALIDFSTASRITISQTEEPFHVDNKTSNVQAGVIRHGLAVNGYNGIYESRRENETFLKEKITFGNKHVTVTLAANILSADSVFIQKVRSAMRSVVLVDEKLPDPTDDTEFKIDVAHTTLKFTRYINGMLVYTASGSMLSGSSVDFIVAPRYGTIGEPEERKAIAEEYVVHEIYYKDVQIKESIQVTIDDMPGQAVTAEGVHDNGHTRDLIYVVMLSGKDRSYVMLGTASVDFKANLSMFKTLAETFQLKR